MAKVRSTVRINTQAVSKLNKATIKALKDTADALLTEVTNAGVVPRDKGTLEDGFVDYTKADQGKVSLVYSTPYARRLYYNPDGFKFHQSAWITKKKVRGKTGKWLKRRRKKIKHDGNPNAKDHWLEDWLKDGKHEDFVPKTFKEKLQEAINK